MEESSRDSWVLEASALLTLLLQDTPAWNSLVGAFIVHRVPRLGRGRIISVSVRDTQSYYLGIQFDSEEGDFATDGLEFFTVLEFPDPSQVHQLLRPHIMPRDAFDAIVRQREEERKEQERREELQRQQAERSRLVEEQRVQQEKDATIEFENLCAKYGATRVSDRHPSNPLFSILKKMERESRLTQSDSEYLENAQQFAILAYHHEWEFRKGDAWAGSQASKMWRKSRKPSQAITFTAEALKTEMLQLPKAAIWTSRGGAYRDLREFDDAIHCANEAKRLDDSSFHPHNLLAAISFDRGDHAAGEEHLQAAMKRGATARDLEITFHTIVSDYKKAAANYLLQTDPDKYAWASRYS